MIEGAGVEVLRETVERKDCGGDYEGGEVCGNDYKGGEVCGGAHGVVGSGEILCMW